ncbi:MAG: hypothetical protein CMI24_00515 [Opitutae bacterium]|nr:hypothetical protein [Opitutae bacterium]
MEINKHIPLSLSLNTHKASKDWTDSQSKLVSGKKLVNSASDSGAFGQSLALESEISRKTLTANNLQNLISFSQSQYDGLQQAGTILLRMNELARLSLDITKTDADRSNYDYEFQELANQLDTINGMSFNGLDLFSDGPFSDEKKQFIQILQTQWLKAAEKVIEDRLGLTGTGRDTFKINVNDTGNEMYSISLTWNYSDPDSPDKSADVASLNYEIYNYNLPISGPPEDPGLYLTDRINAVMMTYAVLADNLHFNALANGEVKKGASNSGGAEWFKSGIADFVHGGDFLLEYTGGFNQSTIDSFGTGDDQAGSWQQRASYYAAIRFLHHELQNVGTSEGVKAMLNWMSEGVKEGLSSEETSIGSALKHFFGASLYANVKSANDEFVQHYINNALNEHNDPSNSFQIILYDADTGAIGGANADGGSVVTHKEAVPDSGDGYEPTINPSTEPLDRFGLKWEKEGIPMTIPNEGGEELVFKFTNSITVDDKKSYNLKNTSSSQLTVNLLENWMNSLNEQKAIVSANLQTLNVSVEKLQNSLANFSTAISRISDTDYASETTELVKNQLKAESSISILSKANENKFSIGQLLEGVKISKKGS